MKDKNVYTTRRLSLLLIMTLLGILTGFAWGYWFGYDQGKHDIMEK